MRRIAALIFAAACLAPATACAAAVAVPIPGGTALVHDGPKQALIVQAVSRDTNHEPLDAWFCPDQRIVVSVVKRKTMRAVATASRNEPVPYGYFERQPMDSAWCKVTLDAPAVNAMAPNEVCHLVLHELGHARGTLFHTAFGLMAAEMPERTDAACDWARPKRELSAMRRAARQAAQRLSPH